MTERHADTMEGDADTPMEGDAGEAAVVRIEQLLGQKDDTSRFVALALLKAVLDDPEGDASPAAAERLLRLWDALPVTFLDRLLRAGLAPVQDASGQEPSATHMRDLAVAVLHTFAVRLPPAQRGDARLTGRIPLLVASLGVTTETKETTSKEPTSKEPTPKETTPETTPTDVTTLVLQTLATLVSDEAGAAVFYGSVDDYGPLLALAPTQPLALDILLSVWLSGFLAATSATTPNTSARSITDTLTTNLPMLVAAFKGTDGVTLLDFVARLLRGAMFLCSESGEGDDDPRDVSDLLPPAPDATAWLASLVGFVRRLAANRPSARSREAYTFAANALVQAYPGTAEELLFGGDSGVPAAENSSTFAYLFINLLLVDLRATLPALLAQINDRDAYVHTAARLASAYDVLNAFVAYLMQSMEDDEDKDDDEEPTPLPFSASNLLRFRASMSEAMSATAGYLRDRWDAAVAGAPGLHPDARTGYTDGGRGQSGRSGRKPAFAHALDAAGLPLAWDAADAALTASRDPLVRAAVRTLSLWLREDDGAVLRREALGLVDVLVDLYATAGARSEDVRLPVLDALEGLSYLDLREDAISPDAQAADSDDGLDQTAVAVLLDHGVWATLTADLLGILDATGRRGRNARNDTLEAYRGVRIAAFLLPIVVAGSAGAPPDEWLDFVTRLAAWPGPDENYPDDNENTPSPVVAQCRVGALQLAAELVHDLRPAVARRYEHTVSAIRGLALGLRASLQASIQGGVPERLRADLDDVLHTLGVAK